MMSSELNVYAGVFTRDIYRPFMCPGASERRLVLVGRIATLCYGQLIIGGALLVPLLGGAEQVILPTMALLGGPLIFPVVWGLFSKKINQSSVWATVSISVAVGAFLKFGLATGWVAGDTSLAAWVQQNIRVAESLVGLVVPLLILTVMELRARGTDAGVTRLAEASRLYAQQQPPVKASTLPAKIVAYTIGFLGVVMTAVTVVSRENRAVSAIFSGVLLAFAGAIGGVVYRRQRNCFSGRPDDND
jgi:Na+/proline symporter